MSSQPLGCTCVSPVNVALVKYWGKKDEELNVPLNSSFSVTLDAERMCTTTKVDLLFNRKKNKSILILNKQIIPLSQAPRVQRVLAQARKRGLNCPVRIETYNTFPTAAGMASSSSGFSALALCLGRLLNLSNNDTAVLARLGSGSSCRSLYGGFVEWSAGWQPDGSDSLPKQIFSEVQWPDLRILVVQVSARQKDHSSSVGMLRTAQTSDLLRIRNECGLPEKHIADLKEFIKNRDFVGFARVIMKESNSLHALCLDTFPPIDPPYLSPVSWKIIRFVHGLNQCKGSILSAYTFDAGPNAFIFLLKHHVETFLSYFYTIFPADHTDTNFSSYYALAKEYDVHFPVEDYKETGVDINPNCTIQHIHLSKAGSGPKFIS